MERRDYLMEQIKVLARSLGNVLANALGLSNEGKVSASIEMVQQQLKEHLGIDPETLVEMSEAEFSAYIGNEQLFHTESLEQLGKIFEFLGDSNTSLTNRDIAKSCYVKALISHEAAAKKRNALALDQHHTINRLNKKIND